jgi:hypothetical protein
MKAVKLLHEDIAYWEDLEHYVVICISCRIVKVMSLFVHEYQASSKFNDKSEPRF